MSLEEISHSLFLKTALLVKESAVESYRDLPFPDIKERSEIIAKTNSAKSRVDISVVIPTFNRPELLIHSIRSVIDDSKLSKEVIVVVDNPEPLPEVTLSRILEIDLPITVVQHGANLGLGAARNTGSHYAVGRWLSFLDDDDELYSGGQQHLFDAAQNSSSEFIFGEHLRKNYNGGIAGDVTAHKINTESLQKLFFENQITCGSFLISQELFSSLGGYFELLPVHEDYNLHIRALSETTPLSVAEPIFTYHLRDDISRMNLQKRAYWFATSIFNHTLYRKLHYCTEAEHQLQVRGQFEHLERFHNEQGEKETIRKLIHDWWRVLEQEELEEEFTVEKATIKEYFPELTSLIEVSDEA